MSKNWVSYSVSVNKIQFLQMKHKIMHIAYIPVYYFENIVLNLLFIFIDLKGKKVNRCSLTFKMRRI